MTMRGLGQFLNALGAAGDEIGKGELRGNMHRLHRHRSWPQDLHHLHRCGGRFCCLCFLVAHLCLLGMKPWIRDYSSLDMERLLPMRGQTPQTLNDAEAASGEEMARTLLLELILAPSPDRF